MARDLGPVLETREHGGAVELRLERGCALAEAVTDRAPVKHEQDEELLARMRDRSTSNAAIAASAPPAISVR